MIQLVADGSNASPFSQGCATTFTFSWEVVVAVETCQEQKLHHYSLQGGTQSWDVNSDTLKIA